MSACHTLRSCFSLKTVLNRLGNTYQAYCNTYKTHIMATHHGGTGQPLDRDDNPGRSNATSDTPQDFHPEDIDDFESIEHVNPTRLATISRELDDLCQRFQAEEGQPTDYLQHMEWELQWLSLSLHASPPPEPLDEVLKNYTDTLCSAQKQTNFTNTLLQDITIFNGNDAAQLEDWLVDIETTADLSAESRTKLTEAKTKGLTHTLITEVLTSDKCWDDIKDLLHLKLCNSDIHTLVSCFMEIQLMEKESLQHISIALKGKPRGVTLQIVQQQSDYSLRDLRMPKP